MRIPINFNHLYYFYVIAREESITDACRILHVTSSTLSNQLREFEDFLETKLFERHHRRLILNKEGIEAFQYASTIFASADSFLHKLKQKGPEHHTFTIGIPSSVPPVIANCFFNQEFEDVKIFVRIERGDLTTLLRNLEMNELDLIFCDSYQKGLKSNVVTQKINEDTLTLVASKKHHEEGCLDELSYLQNKPFLNFTKMNPMRSDLDHFFKTHQIEPYITAEIDDPCFILQHVLKRGILAAVPRVLLHDSPIESMFLQRPTTVVQQQWIIYREEDTLTEHLLKRTLLNPDVQNINTSTRE